MMADSKLKLTYFNVKGLAESIRFIFAYADVDYEDVRLPKADWPAVKESYPFHKLPVLEVDGKVLNQSVAIARYLGKRFELVSDDPLREALLEALIDNLRDLQGKFRDMMQLKTPEAKKDCDEALEFFLNRIEPIASEGYFYGSKPTWVDVYFAGFYDTVESFIGDFLKPYPHLTSLVQKIKSKDSVKRYIEKRPENEVYAAS